MTEIEYQKAVNWLFEQAPNYQIDGQKAYKPGLDNIKSLCEIFGNPQDIIKSVHIAGTNGKGSVSNMVASILQEAGYTIGLYNSPHLVDFTERIKINGENCSREFVYQFIQKLKQLPDRIKPSFFEFTTIMAFEYFYQNKVDFAIIETGLGGRLDSTNIITPQVSAITNVDLDHMNILGNSIEEIAHEKAGIIKKNVPIISGDERGEVKAIIRNKAQQESSPFIDASTTETYYSSDLKGNYQVKNIKVAVAIINELRKQNIIIEDEHIEAGLLNVQKNTGFIGRWSIISEEPKIICDTAHNQAGLTAVFDQLNALPQHKHIVLGFVNDKNIDEVLKILPQNAHYYFVKPAIHRGRDPKTYDEELKKTKIFYKIFNSVWEGYLSAFQNLKSGEMIFIGGSNFVVGEFLEKKFGDINI